VGKEIPALKKKGEGTKSTDLKLPYQKQEKEKMAAS